MSGAPRRRRRWLVVLAAVALFFPAAHFGITCGTHMTPPAISAPRREVQVATDDPTRRSFGASWARKRGRINEVRLVGDPVESGTAHSMLLRDEQVQIETDLHQQFSHYVPWTLARWLIVDMARLRFRDLDQTMGERWRLEIAAQAASFGPDPFSSMMPTYQRFVFLHALYDIMLSFERSPLVGCTSFVIGSEIGADGHTLVGRNFDFEGPEVLDQRKAVFLVLEPGRIPYASVSWPGFVGSATGMNAEGLAIVIHGARAGEARPRGEPVAQTVRDLLGRADSTRAAVALLAGRDPMVPHMLLIADATGETAVVERVPGEPPFVRWRQGETFALTNHLEGPDAHDARNRQVMKVTSTLARRRRLDELLAALGPGVTVSNAIDILRDKRAAGGGELPLGHRSALDALIATHSVVMDTTARELWVSEGPHATGRYLRFRLRELLDASYVPNGPATVESLPPDDIAGDGRYEAWVTAGAQHAGAE
jgi:isopenicillin-N N-acyltransferase like protein